ncbi:NAPDH-dependent diflavin reductase, partial [Elasticomyces elasticus]
PRPRSALILYGSQSGNAQDVAEELGHLTERLRFETNIIDIDHAELRDLLQHTVVLVAISTTGQGEMPTNARSFWRTLLSDQLRPGVLKRVLFSSFGLGDSSYPRYNTAHRMLYSRLVQLGARVVCERGEGNEQHPEGYHGGLRSWVVELQKSLTQRCPLPDGQDPVADDVFLEPKWKLKFADRAVINGHSSTNRGDQSNAIEETQNLSIPVLRAETPPSADLLPIKNSHTAALIANDRITPLDHFQDVRSVTLWLPESVPYGPGAVAVIYPKNFPQDVDLFIKTMDWERIADRPLQLVPSSQTTASSKYARSPLDHADWQGQCMTLRTLCTDYLDIMSIPRRSFFATLAHFAKSGNKDEEYQKERILELANPELIDELWDYTTRPRRTIVEILPEFPSIKIPWQYALNVIPIMRGRQFSIASGGSLKQTPNGGTKVELLVAIADPPNPIIKYRKRHGVCTRYIGSLRAGQQLNIGLEQGYLDVQRTDARVPVVMVGPGTGVAPMRAMIYERLAWANELDQSDKERPLDGDVLFFGCRSKHADHFYHEEWERLEQKGLRVFSAFSRDKESPKTYVQDLIRAQSKLVYQTIHDLNAKLYVCGSSGNMPKGVREAVLDVLVEEGRKTREEAEAYLDTMEREERYKQETW